MTGQNKNPKYRYSIIPGRAVTDSNITAQALRVLALLGRHTDENGWCRRSQVKMAGELACGRATVQRALEELMSARYVERREETRPGVNFEEGRQPHCSYSYRVRLDLEDESLVPAHGHGVVPAREQGVPSQEGHGVPTSRAPLTEPSPYERPLANSDAPTRAGERETVALRGDVQKRHWSEFRKAVVDTWPNSFPRDDEGKAEAEFIRQTRTTPPDTIIAAARLHGPAEKSRKSSRGGRSFFTKLPSTWLHDRGWAGYAIDIQTAVERKMQMALALRRVQAALGPDIMEILRRLAVADVLLAALDGATYEPGPPPQFTCTRFQKTLLERHHFALTRQLGENLRITVRVAGGDAV